MKPKMLEFYSDTETKDPALAMLIPSIRCVNMEYKEEGVIIPRYI